MEDEILREILQEMKGFRSDLAITNSRLENLEKSVNGLHTSLVVMQQAYTDIKVDVNEIKKFLSDRVIWNNDSISIETNLGSSIHGTIHKGGKL